MKKIWISLLNTDCYIRNDIKERKHGMIIDELKKQGKALLDARRDNFVRQSLLSDEFLNFMQQNKKPFDLLMSYYECAIMEIETKFRVIGITERLSKSIVRIYKVNVELFKFLFFGALCDQSLITLE